MGKTPMRVEPYFVRSSFETHNPTTLHLNFQVDVIFHEYLDDFDVPILWGGLQSSVPSINTIHLTNTQYHTHTKLDTTVKWSCELWNAMYRTSRISLLLAHTDSTDVVVWHCLCVCLLDTTEPCKNVWTDWDDIWGARSHGPKVPRIRCRAESLKKRDISRGTSIQHPLDDECIRSLCQMAATNSMPWRCGLSPPLL